MKNKDTFFLNLEKLIKLSGKTINQVERELNYPRNALNNYKAGSEPSGHRLIELSHYFGVSPEYLLGLEKNTSAEWIMVNKMFSQLDFQKKIEMYQLCERWVISQLSTKK